MSTVIALVQVPPQIRTDEIIEVRTTLGHPMETGFRPGADGKLIARNLVERFSCRFNQQLVFSARLYAAVSANPYIAFHLNAARGGALELRWEGDHGFVHVHTLNLRVV